VEVAGFSFRVVAVHAALLPTGKVLFFAGSGSSENRFKSPDSGMWQKGFSRASFGSTNRAASNFAHPPTILDAHGKAFDFFVAAILFCRMQADLSGGHIAYGPYRGRAMPRFLTRRQRSGRHRLDDAGRWYPSLIALEMGESGRDRFYRGVQFSAQSELEIYNAATNKWELHHFPQACPNLPLYAHLFLPGKWRVFFDGGHMDASCRLEPCVIDLDT